MIVHDTWPAFGRADAGVVLVSTWRTGTRARSHAAVEATVAEWVRGPWRRGLLSFTGFVSVAGDSALNYAQWTDVAAQAEFVRTSRSLWRGGVSRIDEAVPDVERSELARHRWYGGISGARARPSSVVIMQARPVRRREWARAALAVCAEELPGPGSCHCYLGMGCPRALICLERTDTDDDMTVFEAVRGKLDERGPGSREFVRYHLHGSVAGIPDRTEEESKNAGSAGDAVRSPRGTETSRVPRSRRGRG